MRKCDCLIIDRQWNSSKWKYAVKSNWIHFVHILQWPKNIQLYCKCHCTDPTRTRLHSIRSTRSNTQTVTQQYFSFFSFVIFFLYLNQYFSKSFSVIIPILPHSICLMRVCHCFNALYLSFVVVVFVVLICSFFATHLHRSRRNDNIKIMYCAFITNTCI